MTSLTVFHLNVLFITNTFVLHVAFSLYELVRDFFEPLSLLRTLISEHILEFIGMTHKILRCSINIMWHLDGGIAQNVSDPLGLSLKANGFPVLKQVWKQIVIPLRHIEERGHDSGETSISL